MLYLMSGAAASGKSTISRAVAERVPNLVSFEEAQRQVATTEDRLTNLDLWIGDVLEMESRGQDVIFGSQSPLGEVLASPRAIELEGIAPCLLDVHDFARIERWEGRGVDPAWPMTMDHFCWAAFHRLHARDPRYEQRVITTRELPGFEWSRWTGWNSADPRWDVSIHDSTGEDLERTTGTIVRWVQTVRANGTALSREGRWWT